jgi:hypothetical protein
MASASNEEVFIIKHLFKQAVSGAEREYGLAINTETAERVIFTLLEKKQAGDTRKSHIIVSEILNGIPGYIDKGDRRSSIHSVVTRYLRSRTKNRSGAGQSNNKKSETPQKETTGTPSVSWGTRHDIEGARQAAMARNEHIIDPDGEDMGYVHVSSGSPFGPQTEH